MFLFCSLLHFLVRGFVVGDAAWTCWRVRRSNVLLGGRRTDSISRCKVGEVVWDASARLSEGEGSSGKLHLGYCCRALVLQRTGDLLLDKDALQPSQFVGPQQHPRKHLRKLSFC